MIHNDANFDVIIVGAGPSGCTCAHYLDLTNLKILLVDKASFPRHKPCAGGITMKTFKHLPINIDHLIQHKATKMRFTFDENRTVTLKHENGSCAMVVRDEFDNYFFNETIKKGVNFRKVTKIKNIERINNGLIKLNIDGKEVHTKFLVGADGANSIVRKFTSKEKHSHPVSAYEGKVQKKDGESITEFVFNDSGYAWIFPKSDHYNVGIGNLVVDKKIRKRSKDDLYDFVNKRFPGEEITDITAFPIGTEGIKYRSNDNIFLVGDAAGLAETLLGEGIYNAVLSGKHAAQSINRSLESEELASIEYNDFLHKLTDELSLYNKGSKILYKFPRLSYFAMKLWLGEKFMRGYSEGKTLSEIMGKKGSVIN